jgi:multiple sugar transport system substrate-binding protein
LLRLQQFGDAVLGLPYHDGPECLIYRSDLFTGGLEVPRTWDEFRDAARRLTRPERGLYGTVFAAFPDGHNTVYDFCLQLWTRGGEISLDSPQAVEALEFYRAMLNDSGAVHPRSREFDSVQSGLAFAAGEVAMMVNWFGFAAMCETGGYSTKGCVDIAEIPHAEGCRGVSLNVYWVLAIAAGSPHRHLAYRFLRHCAGAEMDKLLTLEGAIGCRKSTWQDAGVNRTIPFYRKLEGIHASARELPRLSHWPELAKVIDELVLGVINTSQPVPELLHAAQLKAARVSRS